MNALCAISPLDGRYQEKTAELCNFFSEYALIKFRLMVELAWWKALSQNAEIPEIAPFSAESLAFLEAIEKNFSANDAAKVKDLEKTTNHDVKALEYWIRQKVASIAELKAAGEFIHFACTSEDINNVAHALMLQGARNEILLPQINTILKIFKQMALDFSDVPMMSRTHGQPATPTTMGKEMANIACRIDYAKQAIEQISLYAKMNGAVGNFNAHLIAYPNVDWESFANAILKNFGLTQNRYTIQIEPHDSFAALFDALARLNTILTDACRDIWGYISLGYFRQKLKAGEIGSSTMPHKVNPIDFENAEGNFGMANAMLRHFSSKLPISRFQRDLSDSTVLRNMGVALGYTLLALKSLEKGLNKLEIAPNAMQADLEQNPALLAEAVQTVMRRFNVPNAYESLKALTRGEEIDLTTLRQFIQNLNLPQSPQADSAKTALLNLTAATYLGKASALAKAFGEK